MGVPFGGNDRCLAHLRAAALRQALTSLRHGVALDARGVTFDGNLLDKVLGALPQNTEERVQLGSCQFTEATFSEVTSFANMTFGDDVSFIRASFLDEVSFEGAIFGNRASFNATRFAEGPSLEGAMFGDQANFGARTVGGYLLDAARLGDFADFNEVTFGTEARFNGTQFGGHAAFAGATFGDKANFHGASFGDRANFGGATFANKANFGGAIFASKAALNAGLNFGEDAAFDDTIFGPGADFTEATFGNRPSFRRATLEAASFQNVLLAGADLAEASFDYRTNLGGLRLFTFSDRTAPVRRTKLADVRWNGTSIAAVADWTEGPARVGEDPNPDWPHTIMAACKAALRFVWRRRPWAKPLELARPSQVLGGNLIDAIRTYRQLATLLRGQGMTAEARLFDYRAAQLGRRMPPDTTSWPRALRWIVWVAWGTKRSFSRFVDAVSRYGYSPGRVLATYAATVLIFGVIYRLCGVTRWRDAVPFSLIAFHGRGVINGNIASDSVLLWIPAIEASLGLFIEALLVATLIRRLFRD
jgi:uncharacterized protein YjbI with pentapeptide repeats